MLKILAVFGTRPEAIKMAPVVAALKERAGVDCRVCVTAQHREMLDPVLDLFAIRPDHDLGLMRPGQNLVDLTADALRGVRDVLEADKYDMVLVHGDTTTALSAALAAFYAGVPVGHVEAGLRTGTLSAPWPEEMNRRAVGLLGTLHFAPTDRARDNLLAEGVAPDRIIVTGNSVIDALLSIAGRIEADPGLGARLGAQIPLDPSKRTILVTGHRRENFGDGLSSICDAIAGLAARGDVELVYPVHLNPRVAGPVHSRLDGLAGVRLLPPLDYLPFVDLMRRSYLILTDSGGIQEEAPSLGKPVLVMRDRTERPEAVEAGTVALVGANAGQIIDAATRLLDDEEAYARMSMAHNPYGDGRAAERIADGLLAWAAR